MFRKLWCVLLLIPLAAGQTMLAEDGSNDMDILVADQPMDGIRDEFSFIDLVRLEATEQKDALIFDVYTAGTENSDAFVFMRSQYDIFFRHHDVTYVVEVRRNDDVGGEYRLWAWLAVQDDFDPTWRYGVAGADAVPMDGDEGFRVRLDREDIVDQNGTTLVSGAQLDQIRVESHVESLTIGIGGGAASGVQASDRMPDDGFALPLDIKLGAPDHKDIRLLSESPRRMSNGGAGTWVFQVTAQSLLDDEATFALRVDDVPDGWKVSLPTTQLVLAGKDSRDLPILVTTPSGHQHGGGESFRVIASPLTENRVLSEIELGLRYTEIPMPAGHHPEVWLHGQSFDAGPQYALFGNMDYGFMAAMEEMPYGGTPSPFSANQWGGIFDIEADYFWWYPLVPRLGIGLDFDTNKDIQLEFPLKANYPISNGILRADLFIAGEDDFIVAGTASTDPINMDVDQSQTISLEMPVDKAADFVPYHDRLWMVLEIRMTQDHPHPEAAGAETMPEIYPGGSMMLPLQEYRDPIKVFYDAVESLVFEDQAIEEPANPAETVIIETVLRNKGEHTESVRLELEGSQSEWAAILGAKDFKLARGESRDVAVAVSVPAGTGDGAAADLVLSAVSTIDPLVRAVMDVTVIVDTEADHEDDSARMKGLEGALANKESPGVALVPLLAAIALVLGRRRH